MLSILLQVEFTNLATARASTWEELEKLKEVTSKATTFSTLMCNVSAVCRNKAREGMTSLFCVSNGCH